MFIVRGRLLYQYVSAPCVASSAACGFLLLEAACRIACRQQPQVEGRQRSGNAEGNAHPSTSPLLCCGS